ncbi:MAG: nucleoside monophosphate kinase [Fibrobacter sp.]|uniref:adenylate kinase family protein n=1 Tax=Fibrobacter sp. TaxID=35828 RepID=UPI00388D81AF|nr:nucleoside monophosphate kinase [Fibrobacter sp.]
MAKIPAVLIFGAPGSGKGTVGAKLAATTALKHISTGDIFRGIAPSSESGKLLASYSSKGLLVPDEATVEIFGRFIEGLVNTNKVNPDKDMLLLDGIPRTVAQVKLIESVVDVKHIFVLDIKDEATIVARLLNRAKIEGRKDDADESVIKNRLKVYKESTAKVLGKYNKKIVSHIVGDNTPDEVFCDVLKAYVDFMKSFNKPAKKAPAKKACKKACKK